MKGAIFLLYACGLFGTFSAAVDQWDGLGFGVRPYDGIFQSKHLKARVLDLGNLNTSPFGYSTRARVNVQMVSIRTDGKTTAKGFDEFTRKIRADLSLSAKFKILEASLATHYKFSSTQRKDYFFARSTSIVERAQLRVIEASPAILQSRVIAPVAHFLLKESPQRIFQSYGTHVTTGLVVGGTLEMWSSSQASKFSSESEFKISVEASFKKLIKGSASLTTSESRLAGRIETAEGLIARGGRFVTGRNALEAWAGSIRGDAQEIKYLPDGVIPIWELIPNAQKAGEVKKWYEVVFGSTAMLFKRFASSALSGPRFPWPEAQVRVPNGWKVISGGAEVKFFGVGQMMTKSFPLKSSSGVPYGWKVQSKDHLESDKGLIRAYAVALFDPFDDWDVIATESKSNIAQHPFASSRIPSGYTLVGGGASTSWNGVGSLLVENYPASNSLWNVSSKDHLKKDPGSVVAYAIGMRRKNGVPISSRLVSSTFGPANHPGGSISATRGWSFVGGGAKVSKGGLGNMLVNSYPSPLGHQFYASSKDHLKVDRQRITVYGVEVEGAVYVNNVADVLGFDPTKF